jgi:hypothetical protein
MTLGNRHTKCPSLAITNCRKTTYDFHAVRVAHAMRAEEVAHVQIRTVTSPRKEDDFVTLNTSVFFLVSLVGAFQSAASYRLQSVRMFPFGDGGRNDRDAAPLLPQTGERGLTPDGTQRKPLGGLAQIQADWPHTPRTLAFLFRPRLDAPRQVEPRCIRQFAGVRRRARRIDA